MQCKLVIAPLNAIIVHTMQLSNAEQVLGAAEAFINVINLLQVSDIWLTGEGLGVGLGVGEGVGAWVFTLLAQAV